MFLWILSAIVVALGYFIYHIISRPVDNLFRPQEAEIDTPLNEFKESHELATSFDSIKINDIQSIAGLYEEMCVLHPRKYKNDPRLPEVISMYKKLLAGEIFDPEGIHVPSERLFDQINPDYEVYLRSQRKASAREKVTGKCGWINHELKRLNAISTEEDLMTEFLSTLISMNFPPSIIDSALMEEKMNTFDEEDWKRFTTAVKNYLKDYGEDIVNEFVFNFHDIDILCDPTKIETFAVYHEYNAPTEIVCQIIEDKISMDQAELITNYVQCRGFSWEDATEYVLSRDLEKEGDEMLREHYRNIVKED